MSPDEERWHRRGEEGEEDEEQGEGRWAKIRHGWHDMKGLKQHKKGNIHISMYKRAEQTQMDEVFL